MTQVRMIIKRERDIFVTGDERSVRWKTIKTIQPGVLKSTDNLDIPPFLKQRRRLFAPTGRPVSYEAGQGGPLPPFLAKRQINSMARNAQLRGERVTISHRRQQPPSEEALPPFLARRGSTR
jgi:hypothetical protein